MRKQLQKPTTPNLFVGHAKVWNGVLNSFHHLNFPSDEVADYVAAEKMVEHPGSEEVWSCIIDLSDADIEKMLVKDEPQAATTA